MARPQPTTNRPMIPGRKWLRTSEAKSAPDRYPRAADRDQSRRRSSSGVGFSKRAIHGFIISSGIVKERAEGCAFLRASRRSSSDGATSRKWTSLLAPSRLARWRRSSRSSRAQNPKSRITSVPSASARLASSQRSVSMTPCLASCSGSSASWPNRRRCHSSGGQADRRVLPFELECPRRLSRARETDHQVKRGHAASAVDVSRRGAFRIRGLRLGALGKGFTTTPAPKRTRCTRSRSWGPGTAGTRGRGSEP